MRLSFAIRRPRRAVATALAGMAFTLAVLLAPVGASAHVNRTVGPYTFLVVLVEEPYFATNHAGFMFWVHKGDTPVAGLDRTLHAQATGHGRTVDLAVSPWDKDQLYTVDRGLDGQAFDPLGGGAWSMRLTGTIEGTPVDESFAVEFPAYPRVGSVSGSQATSGAPAAADGELVPPYLVILLVGIGLVIAFRALRRRRVRPGVVGLLSELDGEMLKPSIGRRP